MLHDIFYSPLTWVACVLIPFGFFIKNGIEDQAVRMEAYTERCAADMNKWAGNKKAGYIRERIVSYTYDLEISKLECDEFYKLLANKADEWKVYSIRQKAMVK